MALLALLGPAARVGAASATPAPVVEAVEIHGNQSLETTTLLYYVSTKAGQAFDELRLRRDFRRLWDTGFLADCVLDVSDGQRGKIVSFTVRERLRLTRVEFKGSKALSKKDIEEQLKRRQAELRLDAFYDLERVLKVETIIRELLVDAGRPLGTVRREEKPVGAGSVELTFDIDDGPKQQVTQIAFNGNTAFSDAQLKGRMKAIHERRLGGLSRSTAFTEERWNEDQERLQDFYRSRGYVMAAIGQPVVSCLDGRHDLSACAHLRLRIPITEGERFTLGQIKIEGLTVFPEEDVRALIKLKPGDTYDGSRIKKAYDTLRDWYGRKGYINWTPRTLPEPNPDTRVVDVTLKMEEDQRFLVGHISFTGNTTTRDRVARREISLNEGDVFNAEALKVSLKRLNQLGYFKPIASFPEINPSSETEGALDLAIKVEEQRRVQFNVGGGVSGNEGTFLNSTFTTPNFLGLGDTLQLTAQGGKRIKNYDAAITDPYFLGRPLTAGIDLYHRRSIPVLASTTTAGYADRRTGVGLTTGLPLGRFTRLFGNYTYEFARVEDVDANGTVVTAPPTSDSTQQLVRDQYGDPGQWHDSRFTPTLEYDTVDNRWTPHSGLHVNTSLQISGGPLGGTLNAVRPRAEAALFVRVTRQTGLALHAEGGWVTPFGSTAKLQPPVPGETVAHDGLPFVERFAVGGENQVRGYPYYSIFPALNADGRVVRGDRYAVVNAEYHWDVGPLRLLTFFDAGTALRKEDPFRLDRFKISTGLELRFSVPLFNLPLRFIYAFNPNRDAAQRAAPWNVKAREFKFAVGTPF